MAAKEDRILQSRPEETPIPTEIESLVQNSDENVNCSVEQQDAVAGDTDWLLEENEELRGSEENESYGEVRKAKRRKTCPTALDKLERSDAQKGESSNEEQGGVVVRSGSGGFSFDTTAPASPMGATPKFGSFASSLSNSSVASVATAADFGVLRESEVGGDRGEGESSWSKTL